MVTYRRVRRPHVNHMVEDGARMTELQSIAGFIDAVNARLLGLWSRFLPRQIFPSHQSRLLPWKVQCCWVAGASRVFHGSGEGHGSICDAFPSLDICVGRTCHIHTSATLSQPHPGTRENHPSEFEGIDFHVANSAHSATQPGQSGSLVVGIET